MAELDPKTREMIALGAAFSVNCQTCMEVHKQAALEAGLSPEEMRQAIGVAEAIVSGARSLTRKRTAELFGKAGVETSCCARASGRGQE